MQKISIVVDVQGKIFKTREDKKKFYFGSDPKLILTLTLTLRLTLTLNPSIRVGVNSWENENRWESVTKCKRLVSV